MNVMERIERLTDTRAKRECVLTGGYMIGRVSTPFNAPEYAVCFLQDGEYEHVALGPTPEAALDAAEAKLLPPPDSKAMEDAARKVS